MGRRDDAHVDHLLGCRPDLAHPFFLNGAQELYLHGQRQVRHFIEKQGAATGCLKETVTVAVCASKGPFAITEEFTLHQRFRNRSTVDWNEASAIACALRMNQARRQFLSAAGLSRDVNRRLAARKLVDHLPYHGNGRGRPDQAVRARHLLRRIRQFERRLDQRPQLIECDRLRQIVEGTCLQGCHSVFSTTESGNDGHGRLGAQFANGPHDVQPLSVGKAHVGKTQMVATGSEQRSRFADAGGAVGRQPHTGQRQIEQLTNIRLVVNDQDAPQFAARPAIGTAISTTFHHLTDPP